MKKIFSIIILLFAFANAEAQAPACCPEFKMAYKRDFDCTKQGPCAVSANGVSQFTGSNCKYSTNTFLVVPNLPGYTYSWVVTGGTAVPTTGNPVAITWGGGGSGTIVVTITSADGSCVKTVKETICLRDAPVASFTFGPNNACAGLLINFTNTSTGGAGVSWDFGDGSFAGNVNTPTHAYAASGVYTVTIYVTNDTTPCLPPSPAGGNPDRPCCGCTSIYTQQVTVAAGTPLMIIPKNCINQCLCAGDTMEYCISQACGTYNWTVTGGVFIPPSGNNTQCVKVKWTGPYPTTISFSGSCGNPCGNTATLNVPVLVNNIPILPATSPVCQGSTQTYYLPAMPGALYNWTVTGGIIAGPNTNTSSITVVWGMGTSGSITCTYSNPLKKNCSGTSTRNINLLPVLKITGPTQGCVGCPANFMSFSGPVSWSSPTGTIVFSPAVGPNTSVTFPASATTNTYTITATGPYCNSPVSVTIVVAPKPVLTIAPTSPTACPGTQIKFVATSTVTTSPINWLPLPAGASMIANTGPQMDTAVIQFGTIPLSGVTVTATQNCAFNLACSQGTASVTVMRPPAPILSSPVTNPCIDQTQGYSITNYNPGITYTWTITNNLGTITGGQGTGSINVLWHGNNAAGNTGVLTVSNCAGSASATIVVTIPVYPTITVGGTCIKNGMTLTSSTAGPYSWTGPGIVGSTTTQTININQPGTYCVTINSGAPGSCPQQKCITIPPNPYWVKIIPPCSVASCNPATLSVPLTVATNIPGATNCQWIYQPPVGFPYVISTTCGNYTATLLGTYYLVIMDPNGCRDTSNIIRIPQDINICCTTPACSALSGTHFLFTHSGCQPTSFTGTALSLPPGWTTGTLHPTICYGDGTSDDFISLNTTHQYPAAGDYTACVVQKVVNTNTHDTCCVMDCQHVIIPVVTLFTASYNCNTGLLTMTDGSSYFPSNVGASWSWTYTGAYTGTLTNGQNQSITPTASGNFTITLSITLNGCTSTYSMPILIVLPSAPININPNPTCDGSPVYFSTTLGMASYDWQFGDNSFSLMASPQHIYPGPGPYTVILTVITPDGCIVKDTAIVTVQPKPTATITPNPIPTVCPGTPVTLTAGISNTNGNTMCPAISSYTLQWYNNGNPVGAPTNSPTFVATSYGMYYAVLTGTSPGCNCVITTDTVNISWYPKPIAKIKGNSTVCLAFGSGTINLSNIIGTYPTYNWSSNNPPNISFSPANASPTMVTVTAAGNYQVYLEVIDSNGCKAYDTLCLYASNSPTVIVNSPGGPLCAGNVYNLQAIPTPPTAPPAGYNYLWSNGAGTSSINVSAPGGYSVILTDMNTGCSATSFPVIINQKADLSLFPTCCDTICDNAPINITAPLPVGPTQNVCTVYNIVWLDNGIPVSPQPSPCNVFNTANVNLPLLGLHQISIIVTLPNGCIDTSNLFNLFIKHCGDCDCKESHWGDIILTEGDKNAKANVGNPIKLSCGKPVTLDCNKTYTINGSYICKDTACNGKVTYSLQPPTGLPLTGPLPLTFTPNLNGVYVLTLYGWCGTKKCDSCIIDIIVKCDSCNCKGSSWGKITLSPGDDPNGGVGNPKANIGGGGGTIALNCNKTYKLDCNKPYTINATYNCKDTACPSKVTYSLQPPIGAAITGNVAVTFTPTMNGIYVLTLYGWCNGKICDSCVIKFEVHCVPECDCKGSHWGEIMLNTGGGAQAASCGKTYDIKCKAPFSVNANYICAKPNCPGSVSYTFTPPPAVGLPTSGNVPFSYTPTQAGLYTLVLYGMCGGTICDSCVIRFRVGECPPPECCPDSITVKPPSVQLSTISNPDATVANGNFGITGPAGPLFTEIRAEVVSYNLFSNFNNECLSCKSYPFTWASIYQAGAIGAMQPKITMYNSTVTSFNPAGNGMYQNPREVIWNSTTPFVIPGNINMQFLLPPASVIDCCELTARICVKFTFRYKDCRECEQLICFTVVIKKK